MDRKFWSAETIECELISVIFDRQAQLGKVLMLYSHGETSNYIAPQVLDNVPDDCVTLLAQICVASVGMTASSHFISMHNPQLPHFTY